MFAAICIIVWCGCEAARAQQPAPALHSVFPPGGQTGTSVTVSIAGVALEDLRDIRSTIPNLVAKKIDANQFTLTIPPQTPTGIYDLRAVCKHGMSSPRAFFVSHHAEHTEKEPNDTPDAAKKFQIDVTVNGRIEKPGDVDCYQFDAKAGQRIVLECQARRIDSQLRAVLEVYDSAGKRLAVNRGHTGIDPLIDFRAPADGTYTAKIFDLSYLGSPNHFYRLDIDTKPRVEFAFPCVVERGKSTKVKLFGRNLLPPQATDNRKSDHLELDSVEVEITAPRSGDVRPIPPLQPNQMVLETFSYHYPGSHAPVLIGLTDVPVIAIQSGHQHSDQAREIVIPCEVNGQLTDGDEKHWFAVQARRGEALWLESFGERIGSPVELAVAVLDASDSKELAKLPECLDNPGQAKFPTAHSDPAGRWVAPADGRYLIAVRNRIGGTNRDPRRLYRLSVRREEPDFHLAVIPSRANQEAGLNVGAGGREMAEVIAIRRRGLNGPIRVSAENLPSGIQCPDVWIGPGQDRVPLIVSARRDCPSYAGTLNLIGHANLDGAEISRRALGGTLIWPDQSISFARLTQDVPLATATEAKALLTVSVHEGAVFQESVLDVAFDIEHRFEEPTGPIHVSAVGLPRGVGNTLVTIPAGKTKGAISFFLPESLAPGFHTFALQAEVEIQSSKNGKSGNKTILKLASNPITINVRPSRISLEIDPRTPRTIGRGKIIQIQFTATRKQGFIGKVHTELVSPDGESGVRGRGVTLVGQSDSGSIQVIATDTAPLGRQIFLRLEAVGTVEDQPVYHASRFVELEITE